MYIFLLDVGWDRLHGSVDGFNATRSENGDHVSLSGDRATCQVFQVFSMINIYFNKLLLIQSYSKDFFVARQLSVSSDSRLLDQEIKAEIVSSVIKRPGRPQRPKSELFLDRDNRSRSKRYSAFGGNSPYGKLEAYIKLEQLGEGSYATVFKGFSNLTNQVVALKVRADAAASAIMTDLFCRIIDEILMSYFWNLQSFETFCE